MTRHYICVLAFLLSLTATQLTVADGKPTSLSDARSAVEANLRTPEGKAFDEQLGNEIVRDHIGTMRQCKQANGDDLRSFWTLLQLDKDGTVKEILLYPQTKIGACVREALLKARFSPPPRPAYWVSVNMKMSR